MIDLAGLGGSFGGSNQALFDAPEVEVPIDNAMCGGALVVETFERRIENGHQPGRLFVLVVFGDWTDTERIANEERYGYPNYPE